MTVECSHHGIHFPSYRLPAGVSLDQHIRRLCLQRMTDAGCRHLKDELERELQAFHYNGCITYMLITADLVAHLRRHNVSVQVGDLSGLTSIAGWLLGITAKRPSAEDILYGRTVSRRMQRFSRLHIQTDLPGLDILMEYAGRNYGWGHAAIQIDAVPRGLILSDQPIADCLTTGRTAQGILSVEASDEELVRKGFVVISLKCLIPKGIRAALKR